MSSEVVVEKNFCHADAANKVEEDRNDGAENEVEEEEDMDFNPFLKGTPSPEVSSSLNSEVEDSEDGGGPSSSGRTDGVTEFQNYANPCSEQGENDLNSNSSERKRKHSDGIDNCEEEDAICMRTRAKYSLASFSLDDLEAFLQETDDEDDLRNVDEDEEYRKFRAAVFQDIGDNNEQAMQEDVDDEEENDADFEIELEELLESDVDEDDVKVVDRKQEEDRRRPQTRQNKRQQACAEYEKRLLEQSKRPLRPLLPILPAPVPPPDYTSTSPVNHSQSSNLIADGYFNGFTPQQIGQLHCLIYEHVQLLVQVFTLTAVDVSKQHVASQVHKLITELVHERNEAVTNRSLVYPDVCFLPGYFFPSVQDNIPRSDANGQLHSSHQPSCNWSPSITHPLRTILDVAPLDHCKRYVDDVYNAMRDYRKRQFSVSSEAVYEKEHLFRSPGLSSSIPNGDATQGDFPTNPTNAQSVNCLQKPKKTLAASIVEQAKKQSIAFVPKDISKLAQVFVPFFNPSLFPHKPPPAVVANRVLFTDAEDDLLAIGILEFNNDWKAIQQNFLPCKTKHQIFVRQKNRSSSKAPENSIKAIRRMKSSPLTVEEVERIQEGLRIFKSDWTSVWRFVVPYRDPALLPRLWRIALGTQRSYKSDDAKKAKRRLYESKRRLKMANSAPFRSENQDDDMNGAIDNADVASGAYVHQAFLADWGQEASGPYSLDYSKQRLQDGQQRPSSDRDYRPLYMSRNSFPDTLKSGQQHRTSKYLAMTKPLCRNSAKQLSIMNYRPTNSVSVGDASPGGSRLVKLAPDLPPVNLPPSVRVISEPDFRGSKLILPSTVAANVLSARTSSSKPDDVEKSVPAAAEEHAFRPPSNDYIGIDDSDDVEDRNSDSALEMHPLLFHEVPCYPSNSGSGPSHHFNFFSGNQQLSASLMHNAIRGRHNKFSSKDDSNGDFDFHPLLQMHKGDDSRNAQRHATRSKPLDQGEKSLQERDIRRDDHRENSDGLRSSAAPSVADPAPGVPFENDEIGGNSHLGIVMEQEELNDSDEDAEEHVEFEYEEMADSEEEDRLCESLHRKHTQVTSTKDASISAKTVPVKRIPLNQKNASSFSNLGIESYDSFAPCEAQDIKTSHPTKSTKKMNSKTRRGAQQKTTASVAEQISSLSKPRKRGPRSTAS